MVKDYSDVTASLRRVRAGERSLEDGGKKVWHQGAKSVELLSFVDAQGRVTHQECFLGDEVVVWRAGGTMLTGVVFSGDGGPFKRGERVVPDPALSTDVLRSAHSLLESYAGGDRYLLHMRDVLLARLEGAALDEPRDVTALSDPFGVPSVRSSDLAPRKSHAPMVAACALAAGALVALWLATR